MGHKSRRVMNVLISLFVDVSNKLAYLQLTNVLVNRNSPPKNHEQSYLDF